jgi:hypothetical protein
MKVYIVKPCLCWNTHKKELPFYCVFTRLSNFWIQVLLFSIIRDMKISFDETIYFLAPFLFCISKVSKLLLSFSPVFVFYIFLVLVHNIFYIEFSLGIRQKWSCTYLSYIYFSTLLKDFGDFYDAKVSKIIWNFKLNS